MILIDSDYSALPLGLKWEAVTEGLGAQARGPFKGSSVPFKGAGGSFGA